MTNAEHGMKEMHYAQDATKGILSLMVNVCLAAQAATTEAKIKRIQKAKIIQEGQEDLRDKKSHQENRTELKTEGLATTKLSIAINMMPKGIA
jgi:hypothetical protein